MKGISLTPTEKKVALFTLLCFLAGSLSVVGKVHRSNQAAKEKKAKSAQAIRERLVKADHSSAPRNRTGIMLDLNKASEKELVRLPGLDPALAHLVFQDRASHGPFESVAALSRVRGLNPKRIEALSAFLYVSPMQKCASASAKTAPEKQP